MNPFTVPPGPHKDIDEVMSDIGRRLGIEKEPKQDGHALTLNGHPLVEFDEFIRRANHFKAVAPEYRIRSHRAALRWLIDPIKKFLHWGTRPYVWELIQKQERFNEAALQALWAAQRALDEHQNAIKDAQATIREAQGAIGDAHTAIGRIEPDLRVAIEACRRSDENIRNQGEINQYFEKSRTELFERLSELYKADEGIRREALADRESEGRAIEELRSATRRLFERHDLQEFYDAVKPEVRDRLIDKHRGTFGHLRGLHHLYLERFRGRPGMTLDVGCGRGEFLSMLRLEGIPAWGCDIDATMVAECKKNEVHAIRADGITALAGVEAGMLGGVFASQVIEHLFPGEVLRFIRLSFERLAPGGAIALETVNPQSLGVLAKSYYKDLDHKQAIDPDYLGSLLELAGFVNVEVHKIRPFDAPDRIPDLPSAEELGVSEAAREALAGVVDRLNERIWGSQDYYVFGEKPRA